MNFGRVVTAMVTPMDDSLAVNYEQAKKVANYLIENGSDALVVAGTTGESPTLTKEEKLRLFQVVVEEVGGKVPVIAGTGSNNTAETIKFSKEAEKLGVDALMLVAPYYNKPNQEALYQHFKAIAQEISLPIMLYNVPGRTGINILPGTVARLAEIENIVAMKEASGNLDQISELKRLVNHDFSIYSGDDSLTLPILAVGGCGIVSVAAHVIGREMGEMIDAFLAGNIVKANEIHLQLFPVYKALFCTTSPIPVKAAMNLLGHKVGSLRLPLVDADDNEMEIIKAELKKFGLL